MDYRLNPWRALAARAEQRRNSRLRMHHEFHEWHLNAGWHARAYKRIARHQAAVLPVDTYIDVGCGLGDVLSRLRAPNRIGYDPDEQVVAAARSIHPTATWIAGDLASASATQARLTAESQSACVLALNWTHTVALEELLPNLQKFCEVARCRWLIIDIIREGIPGYLHAHRASDFCSLGTLVSQIRADEIRDLLVFELAIP